MKNKKKILIISSVIVGIIVLALAASYALFRLNATKNENFKIAVGNLELTLDENNTGNNGQIILNNLEPSDEATAKQKDGYSFRITNTGKMDAGYKIYLDDVIPAGETKTRIADSLIWVNITNTTTNDSHTYKLSELTNRLLDTGTLSKDSHYDYVLRTWLDYNATNSEINKYFAVKLRIDSVQKNSLLSLRKLILTNNPLITSQPTLTTSSNNTSDASGLYSMSVTNGFGGQSTQGTTYYFRGAVTNNYVTFAGKTWRIIRINEDGTVRLILDNFTDENYYTFNESNYDLTYMYYSNSNIKNDVETWYRTNVTGQNAQKVASGNYFCEAAKVGSGAGNATMVYSSNYTPDLVCNIDGNNKGLVNNSVGLINYDEVVLAGGYYEETNYDYYLLNEDEWWMMSPAGSNHAGRYFVFIVEYDGCLSEIPVDYDDRGLRPVINLKADTLATGTGTSSDPYVVQ